MSESIQKCPCGVRLMWKTVEEGKCSRCQGKFGRDYHRERLRKIRDSQSNENKPSSPSLDAEDESSASTAV